MNESWDEWMTFGAAAERQANHLVRDATRLIVNETHSAISHRDEPPEAWGDFIYMVPPFLAYYGVARQSVDYLRLAVSQCELYNELLSTNISLPGGRQCTGLWRHIVTQPDVIPPNVCCTDPDVWLTRFVSI